MHKLASTGIYVMACFSVIILGMYFILTKFTR